MDRQIENGKTDVWHTSMWRGQTVEHVIQDCSLEVQIGNDFT